MAATIEIDGDALSSITSEDFNAFLVEKDAEKPCDACGQAVEWFMRTEPNGKPTMTLSQCHPDPNKVEIYFSLFCPNCGHTRLFYAPYIASGVVEMRRKKNGQG